MSRKERSAAHVPAEQRRVWSSRSRIHLRTPRRVPTPYLRLGTEAREAATECPVLRMVALDVPAGQAARFR
jgi:hypothetical protein